MHKYDDGAKSVSPCTAGSNQMSLLSIKKLVLDGQLTLSEIGLTLDIRI